MTEYIFWILIISYVAHILEEYFFNWLKWVKILTGIPISWNDFFLVNAAVIIFGICIAMIGNSNLYVSLSFPALMIINALFFHILPAIISKKLSPGLFTSLALFLPLSIYAFYCLNEQCRLNGKHMLTAFGAGIIIMMYPVILVKIRNKHDNK